MDLISNLIIGIISGIISGVLVTITYRRVDSKRERILSFTSALTFISQFLSFDMHDIDGIYKFIQCNSPPVVYKWSPLKENEREMFNGLLMMFRAFKLELDSYFASQKLHEINNNYPQVSDLKMHMSIISFQNQMRQVQRMLSSLEKEGKW